MAAPRVECPEQHSGSQKCGGFNVKAVGYQSLQWERPQFKKRAEGSRNQA